MNNLAPVNKPQNSLAPKKATFSNFLTSEGVKAKINEVIGGKDGQRFITSVISAVSTNPGLSDCDHATIFSAAMLGEALRLSPSPQLGQYYMVPFKDNKLGRTVAQFQLGYKGYFIGFTQNKTGEEMRLPIPQHLVSELLAKEDYLIADDHGSFTVNRFAKYFRIVRDACGFKYTFKLMRHTGGTAYIETGATTAEAIMFTGHKEERIFNEVYKSPTERMGLNTLNKRLEAEKE